MEIGIWSLFCSIVVVFPVFPIANNMSMWEWFKTGMFIKKMMGGTNGVLTIGLTES